QSRRTASQFARRINDEGNLRSTWNCKKHVPAYKKRVKTSRKKKRKKTSLFCVSVSCLTGFYFWNFAKGKRRSYAGFDGQCVSFKSKMRHIMRQIRRVKR